jgi:hypothetical protein
MINNPVRIFFRLSIRIPDQTYVSSEKNRYEIFSAGLSKLFLIHMHYKHGLLKIAVVVCFVTLSLSFIIPSGKASFDWQQNSANDHFIIYYTKDKNQAKNWTTDGAVTEFAKTLENVRSRELSFGFNNPNTGTMPVWITDFGINAYAWFGGMAFDPYFLGSPDTRTLRPNEPYLVASHEYFHTIQFGYQVGNNEVDLGQWVLEGQARCLQDKWTDALDHEPGLDFASYLGEVKGYLKSPDRTFTDLSYPAALFWTYVGERYSTVLTEPVIGIEVIRVFWEQAATMGKGYHPILAFNKMMVALGHPNETFETVFRDFVVSLVAKDLPGSNVPWKYKYRDEKQTPGSYGPVTYNIDETLHTGLFSIAGSEQISRFTPKYYKITPGMKNSPINVKITQITQSNLFYDLLVIKDGNILDEYRTTSINFTRTVTKECDYVVLSVASTSIIGPDPVKYQYFFSTGEGVDINIIYPGEDEWLNLGELSAPRKFMAQVEALNVNGPIQGLQKSDFYVRFDDYPGEILSCSYIMGQYYLLIQPPANMTVEPRYFRVGMKLWQNLGVADSKEYAVEFFGNWGSQVQDNIILIESTPAMGYYGKLDGAKTLAKMLIDMFPPNGRVGVVHYGASQTTVCDPVPINSYRETAKQTVDGIKNNSVGLPSISKALLRCVDEFNTHSVPTNKRNIYLITAGKHYGDPSILDIIPLIEGNNTKVFVTLIGPDAQLGDLNKLATRTEGTLTYASTPDTPYSPAPNSFMDILASSTIIAINDAQKYNRLKTGRETKHSIWRIDDGFMLDQAEKARISLIYNCSDPILDSGLSIRRPNGTLIYPQLEGHNETDTGDWLGHFVFEIPNATAGYYEFAMADDRTGNISYYFDVSTVGTQKDGFLHIGKDVQETSDRVPILVTLVNGTAPYVNATVHANITAGDLSKSWLLDLYDDGDHGDEAPDDGIYGNIFTRTHLSMPYLVKATAIKAGFDVLDFYREMDGIIPVVNATDTDGDGLPDKWERMYGLNENDATGNNGAAGDPDFDGLLNLQEFENGTDPVSPDSDGGGENDGSEVTNAQDPCSPGDDSRGKPFVSIVPGNAEVELQCFVPANTTHIQIYRSQTGPDMNYTLLTTIPLAEKYNDTTVENNHQYWYRIMANGTGFKTGWSDVVTTTPRTDVKRPWGIIALNNGQNKTFFTQVSVGIQCEADVVEMRIALEPSFANVSWIPVADRYAIDLPKTNGIQYVYAQFKDAAGNIGAGDGYTDYTFAAIDLGRLTISGNPATSALILSGIAGVAIILTVFPRTKGKVKGTQTKKPQKTK